jgi:aspartate aminotransferase
MASSSWIRRMFEIGLELKKKVGADNVFDLTLGNPTMEPPPEFEAELKRLIQNPMPGMHRYMENAGYPETRDAVARQLSIEMGVAFTADNVMMSTGAAAALNCILKTVLNRDEEVIVFAPFFAEYTHYINNHNGRIRLLPTDDNSSLILINLKRRSQSKRRR